MKASCVCIVILSSFYSAVGQSANEVNEFIDAWHLAASRADATKFFGSMADDAIYIGTDASERWTKNEFVAFAKPYFDRGKAWDFKARDRDVHVTSDKQNVWFRNFWIRGWVYVGDQVFSSGLPLDGKYSSTICL